jgi:tRNA(Ile)-lysidine synthase
MSPLTHRVNRAIRSGSLWADDDRIAVALSGGADSVALTLLLAELASRSDWTLAGLIHVHHGLRGHDADADEDFCRELAERLQLPIDVVTVDVRTAMAESRRSLEATARTLRYEAFEAAADRLRATVVVTGHTADDQAETVLLRLLRGAASRGVSAIRPRRGRYARPMLAIGRKELRVWLAGQGHAWREDQSNADPSVPRNRLRREVMPIIERDWPGGVRALARFAELAADDERWLSHQAKVEGKRVVRTGADGVELIRASLAALPVAVARRVVRDALEAAGGTAAYRDVELIRRLARTARSGARADLHGLTVECMQDVLRIDRAGVPARTAAFEYVLDVPGEVRIAETGAVVRASLIRDAERPVSVDKEGGDAVAALQASTVRLPLTVRSRRPGDRFTPFGAPGSRSLQNLMVDRKVPRASRPRLPVVVDADGRIVWLAPLAVAERCRVRAPEAGMVILEFKKGTP